MDLNSDKVQVNSTPIRKSNRGKNWSPLEDETLCEAWLDVSQDPITSLDQKCETFYERVFASFSAICNNKELPVDPETRGPTSLKARWATIQRCVNKFCGFYTQVRQRNQSGANKSDQLTQSLVLYKADQKANFQLMHAYKILENAPKWKQLILDKITAPTKRRNATTVVQTDVLSEEENPSQSDVILNSSVCNTSKQSQPNGKKAAKLESNILRNSTSLAESGRILAESVRIKSIDSERRTSALMRMSNHAIMSVDFQKLSPTARIFYEKEQLRILEEIGIQDVATASNSTSFTTEANISAEK